MCLQPNRREISVLWGTTVRTARSEVTVCSKTLVAPLEVSVDADIVYKNSTEGSPRWKRCFARQLDLRDHSRARMACHVSDRQIVHPITGQVFFESACPFPDRFQGRFPRWSHVTNHLVCQVRYTQCTTNIDIRLSTLWNDGPMPTKSHWQRHYLKMISTIWHVSINLCYLM